MMHGVTHLWNIDGRGLGALKIQDWKMQDWKVTNLG